MNTTVLHLIPIFLAIFVSSCTSVHFTSLKRTIIKDEKTITGSFTLILYGSRHSEDIETIAFLDSEGDEYIFEPYAPEYDFTMKVHVTGEKALKEAQSFVNWHNSFRHAQWSSITDKQGRILGYELRPLYSPLTFGISDVLNINYSLKGNKVVIYIRLKPSVERTFERNDNDYFH
jgi:hypothetical protein